MKRTLRRLVSSILATAVLMCAAPFSAHAENTADENEYFSYNYELTGITFTSIERYFALLHDKNMEKILKYCDGDALKYMKEVRGLYIPYPLRYQLDKSGRVLITPTYSMVSDCSYTIGEWRYYFDENGKLSGYYTGWTKSSLGRRYSWAEKCRSEKSRLIKRCTPLTRTVI